MDIQSGLREIDSTDEQLLCAIGRLRVESWAEIIRMTESPNEIWLDEFEAKSRHFCVFDGNKLIAASRLSFHGSTAEVPDSSIYEARLPFEVEPLVACFSGLATHPKYRNLGCARLLDQVRTNEARKAGCRSIIAHSTRERRKQLEHFGFIYMGEGNAYPHGHLLYKSGVNHIYVKSLLDAPETPSRISHGRQDLVSLLRGMFAGPLIESLSKLGITPQLLRGEFSQDCLLDYTDTEALMASFEYLCSLGLLEKNSSGQPFALTEIGRYVFERTSMFGLLNSYRDFFSDFAATLTGQRKAISVRRLENVNSTGNLHGMKYFPWAIAKIRERRPVCIVDLGCGSGHFLSEAVDATDAIVAVAVDLSATAVNAAEVRLNSINSIVKVCSRVCSAAVVENWASYVPSLGDSTIITLWFVLHEFCKSSESIVEFLLEVYARCPKAEIVIGEIVAIESAALATVRSTSIYPEVQLFHSISGQGLLDWDSHQSWLSKVPYECQASQLHDIVYVNGRPTPSTVVWYLKPKL
ncbi:MAG: bifunctional N-acetyltransferase/class I SAM-dependent methyltransferase [Planctomycetaceae bacterium]